MTTINHHESRKKAMEELLNTDPATALPKQLLCRAAACNDEGEVKALKKDINHHESRRKDMEELLNTDPATALPQQLLCRAAACNDEGEVKALLAKQWDPNDLSWALQWSMRAAAFMGSLPVLIVLLAQLWEHELGPHDLSWALEWSLRDAVVANHVDVVKALLAHPWPCQQSLSRALELSLRDAADANENAMAGGIVDVLRDRQAHLHE